MLEQVLATGRESDWAGWSKHDALNALWLERLAGNSRLRRLLITQLVMRFPFHVRPALHVRRARNAKGLSLFARALLARHRLTGAAGDATEARALLDWLVDHPSEGFTGLSWGYPYPWQDAGFFAPRNFPNRVVTSFVGQALVDGFETLGEARYLDAARRSLEFLLNAPGTLVDDGHHRCLAYVPDPAVTWKVMDVSALVGALAARVGASQGDEALIDEAERLIRWVADKQTPDGAWFYTDPPEDSHITHDNYHTGFILDSLLGFQVTTGRTEFASAYQRGIDFYRQRLFEPSGAPRFMSDKKWPVDIHGCAQGIITFSLQQGHTGEGGNMADRVLTWTLSSMWDPRTRWFHYQRRRAMATRIRELRWCQGWMSLAIATHLEHRGAVA